MFDTVILKVQRPIVGEPNNWLFYSSSRSIFFERAPTAEEINIMGISRYKFYGKYRIKTSDLKIDPKYIFLEEIPEAPF